jgi:hypothetical protein
MGWKGILKAELEDAYQAARGLILRIEPNSLDWKPQAGENWMTTGQLLYHLTDACGSMFDGFVNGKWEFGEGDSLPSVESPSQALERLDDDRHRAMEVLDGLREADLVDRTVVAPWQKEGHPLGYQLSAMIDHLHSHKSQLFYYLKLQGQPVHTGHLWGME